MLDGLGQKKVIPYSRGTDERAIRNMLDVPEKPVSYKPKFQKPEKEIAVLVTGGLDSSALYYMAEKQHENVKAFYVDIGQPYRDKELDALRKMGIKFKLISSGLNINPSKFWKHIIPGRNLYFLTLVAEQLEFGGEIWFGATDGEMPLLGGDKSVSFINYCDTLFARLPFKVALKVPLSEMTKTDIVAWFKENNLVDKLDLTISCFDEDGGHCGKCQACLRKALAYTANGLTLQTNTDVRVGCKEYLDKYLTLFPKALAKKDFSHYSNRRMIQDLEAIKLLTGVDNST